MNDETNPGLKRVSREEFFAALRVAEKTRDITPRAMARPIVGSERVGRYRSEWRTNNDPWSPLWGVTSSDGFSDDTHFYLAIEIKP